MAVVWGAGLTVLLGFVMVAIAPPTGHHKQECLFSYFFYLSVLTLIF